MQLSVRNCRSSRPRPAPIARRRAISWRRAVPRTSSRLATFAHAISSTTPTTDIRIHSCRENRVRASDRPRRPGSTAMRSTCRRLSPSGLASALRFRRPAVPSRLRLGHARARPQSRHHPEPAHPRIVQERRRIEPGLQRKRHPQIRCAPPDGLAEEAGRRDADDRQLSRFSASRRPTTRGVAAVPPPPEPVADHRDRSTPGRSSSGVSRGLRRPARQHLKFLARRPPVPRCRRPRSSLPVHLQPIGPVEGGECPREGPLTTAEAVEQRVREFERSPRVLTRSSTTSWSGSVTGSAWRMTASTSAENRRVGADAQRQGQDGDHREAGVAAQEPRAVTDVPNDARRAGACRSADRVVRRPERLRGSDEIDRHLGDEPAQPLRAILHPGLLRHDVAEDDRAPSSARPRCSPARTRPAPTRAPRRRP